MIKDTYSIKNTFVNNQNKIVLVSSGCLKVEINITNNLWLQVCIYWHFYNNIQSEFSDLFFSSNFI